MHNGVEKLPEGQRACLRLVAAGFEAKEIARELSLKPHTVIERLRAARRTLGVASSREAARLLAAAERDTSYNRHVTNPIGIADPAGAAPTTSLSIGQDGAGDPLSAPLLREVQAPYSLASAEPVRLPWPFPTARRRRNDFSVGQTAAAIIGLTLGLVIAALGAIAIVEQLGRLHAG
jgi:DNA-binding CsgD family transcriptional regulator